MKLCSSQATRFYIVIGIDDLNTRQQAQGKVVQTLHFLAFSDFISDCPKMSSQISKKRKFVADGVFRAELNEFFTRELAEEGYSGCDVRVTHARTEVASIHRH
jgi:hypothetical protein